MKKILLILIISILGNTLFSQNRGFTPIKLPGTSNENLYEYSYALIIGESNYSNGWPSLKGVKTDISEITRILNIHGFYVSVEENLKSGELERVVKNFVAEHGQNQNSRLVIYFAGHGHTITNPTSKKEMGYLVPIDAPHPSTDKTGFLSKALSMERFKEYAYSAVSKHMLFLFDACFAGIIFNSRSDGVPPAISNSTSFPVRQFITSGSAGETVPDESLFRKLVVRALETNEADGDKDGYLSASELGYFLQNKVSNYSNGAQNPRYGKIRDADLDRGDFVFELPKEGFILADNPDKETNFAGNYGTFTDERDGRKYKWARIGEQIWMAENLAYNGGEGGMIYENDESYVTKYGRLYNWQQAIEACPAGWHLPKDDEWEQMINYIGDMKTAGKILKAETGWKWHGANGTNKYGYNGLPGGNFENGNYYYIGEGAYWWSFSEYNSNNAYLRDVGSNRDNILRYYYSKNAGLNVRCLKN